MRVSYCALYLKINLKETIQGQRQKKRNNHLMREDELPDFLCCSESQRCLIFGLLGWVGGWGGGGLSPLNMEWETPSGCHTSPVLAISKRQVIVSEEIK